MNATPTIKAAAPGPGVDAATARLLLEHFLDTQEIAKRDEVPDLAHKRATNERTGEPSLPPQTPPGDPTMPMWDKTDLVSSVVTPTVGR